MKTNYQHQKISEALDHVSSILRLLRVSTGTPWLGYFERLEHALKEHDVEGAVRARDDIPGAGMGGFLEYLECHPEVHVVNRELMELIGDLKLSARYGVERNCHSPSS